MALFQRLPPDPEAIDIAAIQKRKTLEIWHRKREDALDGAQQVAWWKGWLFR